MNRGVVSDAGHGGHDAGAVNGATGHRESDIVLDFSNKFCEHFERLTDIKPVKTRDHDVFVTLSGRAQVANDFGIPLISWHCNAFNAKADGVEAFTTPGKTASDPLATKMLEAFAKENPRVTKRFDLSDGDPDKEARFTVLTKTRKEAVLFELGFIDSPEDIQYLSSEVWRERNAEVQARVVAGHFGLLTGEPIETPDVAPDPINLPEIRSTFENLEWQVKRLKGLLK